MLPSASSNRPMRRSKAPGKAPFSCPNSALSIWLAGIAPQLKCTICRRARGDAAWIASASTSLPTPLSPSTSTGTRARAAFAAIASAARNCGADPTTSSKASGIDSFSASGRSSPVSPAPAAASRAESSRSGTSGFTRKSLAPARIAATACATEPSAVSISSGSAGRLRRSAAIRPASSVSVSGNRWSSRIASSDSPSGVASVSRAESTSSAKIVRQLRRAAITEIRRRCAGSSSITISRRWPLRVIPDSPSLVAPWL